MINTVGSGDGLTQKSRFGAAGLVEYGDGVGRFENSGVTDTARFVNLVEPSCVFECEIYFDIFNPGDGDDRIAVYI